MKKLLLLASNWPEPASSAAGLRTLQILNLFLEEDWEITLMTAAEKRPHSAELPSAISTRPLLLNSSDMEPVFQQLQPNVVWFDRYMLEEQYGWRITAVCPDARRVVDTIDLHSLREIRKTALHQNREPEISDWFCDTAMRELASIYRSDLSILISDAEHRILAEDLKLSPRLLQVTPFLLEEADLSLDDTLPGFRDRKDFSTIGNFRHPPNADSVRHLSRDLWPRIRERCPGACLHVYGADLTPALQSLHSPQHGFLLEGRAEDAREALAASRICLAPLRFGAGLKGKLLDAMRSGTPSITTPIGAEGMQGSFPWPGAVEQDLDRFVDAAARLYKDSTLWQNAQKKIPDLLAGQWDKRVHGPRLLERIENLLQTPRCSHPDQLVGALLRHHQHRSTEFMSRWIEAKNR